MNKIVKLLFIIDDLRVGGTEIVLSDRILNAPSKYSITVITLFAEGDIGVLLRSAGVDVICLNLKKRNIIAKFCELRRILKSSKFDVAVCMRDVSRALFPFFLQQYVNKIFLFWDSPLKRKSFIYDLFEVIQTKITNFTPYCSTKFIKQTLLDRYKLQNINVIYNSYNQNSFFRIPKTISTDNSKINIVTVGGERIEKNHSAKIAICSKLKELGIDFNFVIVGGDKNNILQNQIVDASLSDNITITGEVENVIDYLRDADLFLFTSFSEGCPVALLEAMAVGVPILSFSFPGIEEIDRNNDFIDIIQNNSIDETVDKIIFYHKNRFEMNKKSEVIANYAKLNFSSEYIRPQFFDMIEGN